MSKIHKLPIENEYIKNVGNLFTYTKPFPFPLNFPLQILAPIGAFLLA